jgi:hypothetical protein
LQRCIWLKLHPSYLVLFFSCHSFKCPSNIQDKINIPAYISHTVLLHNATRNCSLIVP